MPAALQDAAHEVERHLVERHAEDGERHDGLGTHRIDIRDRVGRGNPAEIERIIDDRHEEIGGGDDAQVLIHLPHRCIIAGLGADEKLPVGLGGRLAGEELLQDRRGEFAPAAAAMSKTCQPEQGRVHRIISWIGRAAVAAAIPAQRAWRQCQEHLSSSRMSGKAQGTKAPGGVSPGMT
jgi:hypothetical protein